KTFRSCAESVKRRSEKDIRDIVRRIVTAQTASGGVIYLDQFEELLARKTSVMDESSGETMTYLVALLSVIAPQARCVLHFAHSGACIGNAHDDLPNKLSHAKFAILISRILQA